MQDPSVQKNPPQIKTIQSETLARFFAVTTPDAVKFVDALISEAIQLAASDVLFEPLEDNLRIRVRVDGVLYHLGETSLESYASIASRIKILAKLNPAEKRRIQEGQITINYEGKQINLRVETTHTIHGELVVIRVHEKATIVLNLSQLGFSSVSYQIYQNMLSQRSGLILVCGPTGCGKTTTLYSTIAKLNENQAYNIMTIENPVEFQLEGVNQMQTQEEIGFTFAEGLKAILRLSPDIILVGEIRDKETAEIAVESGLTGQLVFSTIHAGDSVGALFRLLDLGIDYYFLNASLMGIVAQRLVRRVCQSCKAPYEPSQNEVDLFTKIIGRPPKQLVRGRGCEECRNLTYHGRMGLFEVFAMTPRVRSLIRSKANEDILRESLMKEGFVTLLRDGLEKAEQGETTIEEVLRNSLRVV